MSVIQLFNVFSLMCLQSLLTEGSSNSLTCWQPKQIMVKEADRQPLESTFFVELDIFNVKVEIVLSKTSNQLFSIVTVNILRMYLLT